MKQLILVLLCFACSQTSTPSFDKSKMDGFLSHIEKNAQGMGSLSIFQDGKEVYQKSFGYADVESKIPADAQTKYRIGSISKTFTATIIMQLVAEGKLGLETKLSGYYPEIRNSDQITIEHLLRHRSGIFNLTNAQDYKSWDQVPVSSEGLVTRIVNNGNVFVPGEKAEYSNSNYILLSFIAEKIEQKEFSEILQERICKPCALKDTYYGGKIAVDRNEARSYSKGNDKEWAISTETDMSIPVGAGAVVSNPTDLNKFLNCLFIGKLASTVSLETMMEIEDRFGIGMFQVPFGEKKAYGHSGGIDGFQSNAFLFPEENMSVAYTTNAVSMAVNNILIGVLSIYFGKNYEFPVFTEALAVKSEELDQYLGVYSSPTFPLKITISKKDDVLMGQATGQPAFPLEAYEKNKFRFDAAQLTLEFHPDENKMVFTQRGHQVEMMRE